MKLSAASIKKSVKALCGPAQFYLVFSLVSLVLYLVNMLEHKNKMNTASGLSIQAIVVIVWTYILNWVCSMKHGDTIAWVLVFLPLIMLFTILIIMYHLIDTMNLNKDDLLDILKEDKSKECKECS